MKFRLLLAAFLLTVFSVFFTSTTQAAGPTNLLGVGLDIQDFCKARQGNTVNLETWYSGKCPDDNALQYLTGTGQGGPVQSGEYRGFSDIVILDLITKILPENPKSLLIGDAALPSVLGLMAKLSTSPPASFTNYLAYTYDNAANVKLVKPAFAQESGVGFSRLRPILPAWRAIRNFTYLIFVLVFVIYGFMLMFRVKIDPKLSTSIELALPKIVITLLAITFSYAIAGLIIDLSFLIPAAIVQVLQASNPPLINLNLQNSWFITQTTPFSEDLPVKFVTGQAPLGAGFLNIITMYELIVSNGFGYITELLFGLQEGLAAILLQGLHLILSLILIAAFLYVIVKVFFMMIQSYAKIILSIIFSPLILLGNVLPGNDAIGTWIRDIFAEISVFPTVLILTMVAVSLLGDSSPISGDNMWVPANWSAAGQAAPTGKGASALLAYGIILLMPKIADIIKASLQIKPFPYGAAIGEGLGFGVTGPLFGAAALKQVGTGEYGGAVNTLGQIFGQKLNLPSTLQSQGARFQSQQKSGGTATGSP